MNGSEIISQADISTHDMAQVHQDIEDAEDDDSQQKQPKSYFNTHIEDKDLDRVVGSLPPCVVHKKVLRLLLKKQVKQRSEEWYAARKSILSASDAAAALGLNPHCKPKQLIKKKLGFFDNAPPDPNMVKATEHGIKYEDEAAAAYAVLRPDLVPFFELGLIMHDKHPFLGASPDRITKDGILIEIKVLYS